MHLDVSIGTTDLWAVGAQARRLEALGFAGIGAGETAHDALLPLALAAEHTTRVQVATNILIAFARTPMTLAYTANDLQRLARGRLILGLGSQVRPHVTRRFAMPWSEPAARMAEYLAALQAIWSAWNEEQPLDFRGQFYEHSLMTPAFTPPPNPWGRPGLRLAAVGPKMTEVAGAGADGVIFHAFTTRRFVTEQSLPALARGASRAGRPVEDIERCATVFVVSGKTEEEMAASATATKRQIAFYASTPAYHTVLAVHGWEDLQPPLHALSREGRWQAMGELVDDEVLEEFAIVAEPGRIASAIATRWGGLLDRINLYSPGASDPDPVEWASLAPELAAVTR